MYLLLFITVALLLRLVSFFTFRFIDSGGGSDTVTCSWPETFLPAAG